MTTHLRGSFIFWEHDNPICSYAEQVLRDAAPEVLLKPQSLDVASPDEDSQIEALRVVMNDTEYARVSIGYEYGVAPNVYVSYKELIKEINPSGGVSQDEAKEAINRIPGLSEKQKAVLFQLQNKSWKKNPYNTKIGDQVREAMG